MNTRTISVVSLMAIVLLALGSAFGGDSEKVKSRGVVTNRDGNNLTVKTPDGPYTVVIDAETKVQQPVGLTGIRKKEVSSDVIIPGLKMSFEGVGDAQKVMAKTITFDSDDLALAEVIQAGLNPTAQQQARNMETYQANKAATDADIAGNKAAIAANDAAIAQNKQMIDANKKGIKQVAEQTNKRFTEMTQWNSVKSVTVNFQVGQSNINKDFQQQLQAFAQDAQKLPGGWMIEVRGYADATGSAAVNQQLSKERAQAVVAYFLQDCQVPVRHIIAPGAMSESNPVASNETSSGRAENRRVEVRLLVTKAAQGMD